MSGFQIFPVDTITSRLYDNENKDEVLFLILYISSMKLRLSATLLNGTLYQEL